MGVCGKSFAYEWFFLGGLRAGGVEMGGQRRWDERERGEGTRER